MQVKKVLFINTETAPYVPDSALSLMGKKVPEKIQSSGCEIRTFMPRWGCINERRGQLHEVIRLSGMNIIVDDSDHPLVIKVASIPASRLQVYFIDNEDYFARKDMARDENGQLFADNGERLAFFARGVLETVKKLRWTPDIIHCQGWISAAVPLYVRTAYNDEPCFHDVKIVSTLHGMEAAETLLGDNFKKTLAFRDVNADMLKAYKDNFDYNELGKLSIDYSDGVIAMTDDADASLMEYAKAANKAVLPYQGEDFLDSYKDFYNSL